jgi:hypothetical protein
MQQSNETTTRQQQNSNKKQQQYNASARHLLPSCRFPTRQHVRVMLVLINTASGTGDGSDGLPAHHASRAQTGGVDGTRRT